MRLTSLLPFVAVTALSLSPSAQAATTITWWHAMEGVLGEKVNAIAEEFNASQNDYVVKPVYKGSYSDNLTATIAAFRAGQAPAITQVFEVGTATMMNAKGEQPRNHIEVPQVDLVLLSYSCFLIRNPYRLFYNRSS